MMQAGRGTILITGGMSEPIPEVTSLSLGRAGVRALTGSPLAPTGRLASMSQPSP